jgi:DNA-binding transcriptional MerR regulator
MSYTINQLAKIAGVSVRTLHHYDDVGLLVPKREDNKYRVYEESDLLHLQQILFFRELEFPLDDIKRILNDPRFNLERALVDHKKLIEIKKKRLNDLVKTIDKTIKKINKQITMKDEELYGSFSKNEMNEYAEEAKKRWGHTEAYKQSQERTKNWTQEDYAHFKEESDRWMKNFVAHTHNDPQSPIIQTLINEHYNSLRTFYEPSIEMYRGLADMYINDPRFKAYYEKYKVGLAQFMHDAMYYYCDNQK